MPLKEPSTLSQGADIISGLSHQYGFRLQDRTLSCPPKYTRQRRRSSSIVSITQVRYIRAYFPRAPFLMPAASTISFDLSRSCGLVSLSFLNSSSNLLPTPSLIAPSLILRLRVAA